jgi:hypothetical protein
MVVPKSALTDYLNEAPKAIAQYVNLNRRAEKE